MSEVPPEFAKLLEDRRETLNQRFVLRRRGGARIDAAAFLEHVRDGVGPLVLLVNSKFPERAATVLTALYDASLDLFAASLLGPDQRLPAMNRVWADLGALNVSLLAREPVALIGCLCNALDQVAGQRGTNVDRWLTRMHAVLPHCTTMADVTAAGVVAAWQAGMPQYRTAALKAAAVLRPDLAAPALGLPNAEQLTATLTALNRDRWHGVPGRDAASACTLVPVGVAGAFTGLGGLFSRPPTVACRDGRLVASVDDRDHWEIVADAFGVWFRRFTAKGKPATLPKDLSIDTHGTLHWGRRTCKAPHLAAARSLACDGITLAVTIPTSHHVFLFAPGPEAG